MEKELSPELELDAVMADARREGASALVQLEEVTAMVGKQEYARALGAFQGLDDRVHYVAVVLHRFARHVGLHR